MDSPSGPPVPPLVVPEDLLHPPYPPKQKEAPVKRKWARIQAAELKNANFQKSEGQQEYNIWYNKFLGDYDEKRAPAETRCDPIRDPGCTRADFTNPNAYICLYFAKGCCVHGKNCSFLHRIPTDADQARLDMLHDVFGRDRHKSDRADMGGVGSFSRDNRTLFLKSFAIENEGKCQAVLEKHFGAWGVLEEVNVKQKHGIAFIRYKNRANAEFAKIAMEDQALDAGEQLNVRWANDDPNPRIKEAQKKHNQAEVLNLVLQQGYAKKQAPYDVPRGFAK